MEMDGVEKIEEKITVTITNEKKDDEKKDDEKKDGEKKDEQKEEKKDDTAEISKNEKDENTKNEDEDPAKAFTECINTMMRNLSVQLGNEEKEGTPLGKMMREISQGLAKNQDTPAAACATCPPSSKKPAASAGLDLRPLIKKITPCSTRSGCSPCAPRRMTDEERAKRISELKERQTLYRQPRRGVYVFRILDPNESAQNVNANAATTVDEKSAPATIKV